MGDPNVAMPTNKKSTKKKENAKQGESGQEVKKRKLMMYAVGDTVKYWSKKISKWIPGIVKARNEKNGNTLYDVACNNILVKGSPGSRIRLPKTREEKVIAQAAKDKAAEKQLASALVS